MRYVLQEPLCPEVSNVVAFSARRREKGKKAPRKGEEEGWPAEGAKGKKDA